MHQKYLTIDEIKEVLSNNPLPENFGELSSEEQEKYFTIIEDVFNTLEINGPFSIDEVFKLVGEYTIKLEIKDEKSFTLRYLDIMIKLIDRLQNDILNALNNGLIADDKFCDLVNNIVPPDREVQGVIFKYDEIFELIVTQNAEFLKYYKGYGIEFYEMMLDNGYPIADVISKINVLTNEESKRRTLQVYKLAIEKGYPIDEIINSFGKLMYDTKLEVIIMLLKDYPDQMFDIITQNILLIRDVANYFIKNNDCNNELFVKLCPRLQAHHRKQIVDKLQTLDNLTIETINALYRKGVLSYNRYDSAFIKVAVKDNEAFRFYKGRSLTPEICQFMYSDDYPIDEAFVEKLKATIHDDELYSIVFKKVIAKNVDYVKYYMGYDYDIYKIAIKNGFDVSKELLINVLLHDNTLTEEDLNDLFSRLGVKPFNHTALGRFRGDKKKLIDSFDKLDYFLELLNIDRESFIQYAFASSYNWLDSILDIIDNNEIYDFISVKKCFFEKYYNLNNDSVGVLIIKSFIDIIKNYHNYPDLCKQIVSGNLTPEDYANLRTLFDNPNIIRDQNDEIINEIEDLKYIDNIIFKNYELEIKQAIESNNLDRIKNIICKLLFNVNYSDIKNKLNMYGTVKDLRQLLFNNRNNREMANSILEMMVYISMMEDIVDCDDIENLKGILNKVINNKDIYKMCQKCNSLFKSFDDKMNNLYAREMNANLTDLTNIPRELIDQAMTSKYGVEVIDLTDRKYCLLEHVKSQHETVESLVNGTASGRQLFICLSLGSNRNQRLYGNARSIIFGCCSFKEDLFINSSITNMSSNGYIREYSYEVDLSSNSSLKERGAIETSSALEGYNSEVLCYREGLKFDYIILPGGREPTDEELEIARTYHLKFVKVQALNNTIENPKDIREVSQEEYNHQRGNDETIDQELTALQRLFRQSRANKPRKIAIFTDSHGLFEPTLAILEDARRSGISEIYSLGDNIGTGPNPREVMDLLEIYGVKSLKGNHEIYASGELSRVYDHLRQTGAEEEALRNGTWTRSKLTKEQMEKIKSLPDDLVVTIGGKKVLLSHYIKDDNTEVTREIPEDIDDIFQGHIHFESEKENVHTVRGAGIGGESGTARYVVLTEKPDGGYDIEVRTVNFNTKNTQYDIIESDMADRDKSKISSWVGGRSR